MRSFILIFILAVLLAGCTQPDEKEADLDISKVGIERTANTLLRAIETKDLEMLRASLSPSGEMELILPGAEVTYTVNEFIAFHKEWFKDETWTMETKILTIQAGRKIGAVTTEAMYREPDRNGVPYFNRMIVSYVFQNENGVWRVIKDHASSIEKSTEVS